MPRKFFETAPDPDVIALKCLSFLAEDSDRLGRFLALTGIAPDALRREAGKPSFLAGVLDYLTGDEKLLLAFSESQGLKPETVMAAGRKLAGDETC